MLEFLLTWEAFGLLALGYLVGAGLPLADRALDTAALVGCSGVLEGLDRARNPAGPCPCVEGARTGPDGVLDE